MKNNKQGIPIIPLAVILVILVTVILLITGVSRNAAASEAVEVGVNYLQSLENKDPAVIDAVRKQIQQDKLNAQRDALIAQVTSGEVDVWTMFQDFVILGDSRAVGFYYFDFLEQSRVLAGGGDTIRNIELHMDEIVALNPSYIFLCYGLNDTSIGYWDTKEEYCAEYMQIVDTLNERLPDATVIISSILPARDPAFQRSKKWYNIPEWSTAVEAACKEHGVIFVNNDAICQTYANLWQTDGIHVRPEFYPYWASNLITAMLMGDSE